MRSIGLLKNKRPFLLQALIIVAFLHVEIMAAFGQKLPSSWPPAPNQAFDQRSISGNSDSTLTTSLVSVAVTITDRDGRPIAGLHQQDFRIYDDKVEQAISFFSEEDTPASVAIVFDTSKSMSGSTTERAGEALSRFIQTSHQQDEFFLIGFGSRPQLLLAKVRNGDAVLAEVTHLHPAGDTALYDAVEMGLDQLSQGAYPKHALILISDGEENKSRCSFGQLRRKLLESGAVVYTVRVGRLPLPKSFAGMVMDQLAKISGGNSLWPNKSADMDDAFEQIALDLRRQYSIGYLPSNFLGDGKLHKIGVALNSPSRESRDAVVRNRQGYYAWAKPAAR